MNNGGVNVKTIIVIVILLLVGVLGVVGVGAAKTYLSGASAGNDPKGVLATPGSDGKTATVTWSTDKAVEAVVLYGTSPAALLLSAPETDSATDHSVVLSPLRPGQNYYFQIEVGDEMFENGGIPWSFKTSGSSVVVPTAVPTAVPTTVPAVIPVISGTACNRTTDYNHDGTINTFDYIYCLKNGGTAGAASPSGVKSGTACNRTTDYNHDGVINTVDYIYCLKNGGVAGSGMK